MPLNLFDSFPKAENPRLAASVEFPWYIEDVVLATDTLALVQIPDGARFALFSFNGNFRAKLGTSATTLALPSATSIDGSGSELNPTARRITDMLDDAATVPTHIALRAAAACSGSISFYK